MAEIRAIVLDFNGTLAQDDHLVAPLYVDMFASVGVPLTVEDYFRDFAAMPVTLAIASGAFRREIDLVLAIRGPGYDPESGAADLTIDRLEVAALETILALGAGP